jgi:hypothetical protein
MLLILLGRFRVTVPVLGKRSKAVLTELTESAEKNPGSGQMFLSSGGMTGAGFAGTE